MAGYRRGRDSILSHCGDLSQDRPLLEAPGGINEVAVPPYVVEGGHIDGRQACSSRCFETVDGSGRWWQTSVGVAFCLVFMG